MLRNSSGGAFSGLGVSSGGDLLARASFDQQQQIQQQPQQIRIVVLGAKAVGKTCLVQQFVRCACPESYEPTRLPAVHWPAIQFNEKAFEARLVDCPPLPYFPANSLQEFAHFRGYGLRTATAYVLVYDVTSEASFRHARRLRQSIREQRAEAPVLVVANKLDLVSCRAAGKEAASAVRKQWKCQFAECSAKYNWRVQAAFRDLIKAIEHQQQRDAAGHRPASARVQEALRRNQCCVM